MASEIDRIIREWRRALAAADVAASRQMAQAWRIAVEHLRAQILLLEPLIAQFPPGTRLVDVRGRPTRFGMLLFNDWRYRRLISLVEAEFARFTQQGLVIIDGVQVRAVSGGAAEAVELVRAAGIEPTFGEADEPATEWLVGALQSGSPVKDILDGYGWVASLLIKGRLIAGIVAGDSPRKITMGILRALPNANRARMDALVRTEMMRAFRGSLMDQYGRMGVQRWRWIAARSKRTCLACLAKHGTTYPMTKRFFPGHVNCRCIPSPYTQAVTVESGEAWLRRQTPETQRAMMPSQAAYEAWQSGELPLSAFVGTKRSRTWGTSIVQRSGAEALRRVA